MSFPERALTDAEVRRLSRRALLSSGASLVAGIGGLYAFDRYAPSEPDVAVKTAFRSVLEFNERIARGLFSPGRLAPEFGKEKAVEPRNNYHGATPEVDIAAWRLNFDGRALSLEALKALGEVEQTTELKCVEGWSSVVTWAGCRFVDFAAKFPAPTGTRYVALRSEPAGFDAEAYYVGLDLESCLHPQTLLAWSMNGAPLETAHGAPLRLVMPHKYGIKNIKLITHLAYSADRPADYWAEQGYDYYAGL